MILLRFEICMWKVFFLAYLLLFLCSIKVRSKNPFKAFANREKYLIYCRVFDLSKEIVA